MAEANNKLGANGLVLGAQTPSEISSHDDAGTGKVLLYASGSGANAKLYYKGGGTTQRALGTDIESLPAITGSGLDAADLIMVADTDKGEGNEVKVTMTALGTFLAGDSGSGLDASSGRLSVDVGDFLSTGLEDNGSNAIRLATQGTGIAGGNGSTLSVAATQTTITSITMTVLLQLVALALLMMLLILVLLETLLLKLAIPLDLLLLTLLALFPMLLKCLATLKSKAIFMFLARR